MKKLAKFLLLAVLMISICSVICSCGNGLEGEELSSIHGCTARFDNGTLYLDVLGDLQSYSYEMGEDNSITIDGTVTYTYEIDGDTVTFSDDFMGVSDTWWK